MIYNNLKQTINTNSIAKKFLIASIIGILLSIIGFYKDPRFFYSYLACYMFFTTLSLGGLFFVLAHHMFGADWSVPIRRFAENLMLLVPLMLILSIPIIINFDSLYVWTDPVDYNSSKYEVDEKEILNESSYDKGVVEKSNLKSNKNFWKYHPTMISKTSYLNKQFFFIRMIFYFICWFVLIFKLYSLSLKQKNDNDKNRMKKISAIGIAIFALTISFFGFDAIMSMDPTWFSTMFGVYVFAGSYYSAIGLLILVCLHLRSNNILVDEINDKHYANLGKIAFTFTVFWAYIGGFQYYIIWYANLPEEINWFIQRWTGPFKYMSLVLIFGHFVIPFILLIFNRVKRNKSVLKFIGFLILIMHWLDMYWMIMPNYFRDSHGYIQYEELNFLSIVSWTDFSLFIAIGGLFMAIYSRLFKVSSIVPVTDSAYNQSITEEES